MAQRSGELERKLGSVLDGADASVAVAESLTGGELSARLAAIPGSGQWYRGGVVAYASGVKHGLLRVPAGPVVSARCAARMADSVCELLQADIGVAVTGVAGPDGQDGERPGTVWVSLADRGRVTTERLQLAGSPDVIVDRTCHAVLTRLLDHCSQFAPG
jgi:nicotinamide-nucleotide amidase